jgi:hypothetical protein
MENWFTQITGTTYHPTHECLRPGSSTARTAKLGWAPLAQPNIVLFCEHVDKVWEVGGTFAWPTLRPAVKQLVANDDTGEHGRTRAASDETHATRSPISSVDADVARSWSSLSNQPPACIPAGRSSVPAQGGTSRGICGKSLNQTPFNPLVNFYPYVM